jgi:hypothetical protein
MSGGARSPEELEMLFEDALVVGDTDALRDIFEAGAILVTAAGAELRGRDAIADACLGDVVTAPSRILQAGRTALVLGLRSVSVVRRGTDHAWRYAITVRDA